MPEDHRAHRLGYARAEAESRYQDADHAQIRKARDAADIECALQRA